MELVDVHVEKLLDTRKRAHDLVLGGRRLLADARDADGSLDERREQRREAAVVSHGGFVDNTAAMTMTQAIARVTSVLCIPYGYTVTLWCAGAITVADQGLPSRIDVVFFATGAVAAFLLLGFIGHRHLDREVPMRVPNTLVANAFPVVVAVLLAALPMQLVGRQAAFVAASFIATSAYVLCLAAVIRSTSEKR